MSIKTKLIGAVVILLVVSVGALLGISNNEFAENNKENTIKQMQVSINGLDQLLVNYKQDLLSAGKAMSFSPGLPEALAAVDRERVVALLDSYAKQMGVDVVIAVNAQGIVAARTHDPKFGDSIGDRAYIRDAFAGKESFFMESTAITKLSMRGVIPVRNSAGNIVGALVCGKNMLTGTFVDTVKQFFDVEATIFIGDTRESTTMVQGGKRAEGTKASPEIVEKVLQKGEIYVGEAEVFGKSFMTIYKPLVIKEGEKPAGMYFVGRSREAEIADRNELILKNVVVASILLGIGIVLTFLLVSRIIKPIPVIAKAVDAMAIGDMRQEADVISSDELGALAKQFNQMRKMLSGLIGQLVDSSNTLAASSEQLFSNAENSSYSIEQITKLVSNMAQDSAKQVMAAEQSKDTINKMSQKIGQTADEAEKIAQLTKETVGTTEEGRHAINQAVGQMSRIVTETQKVQSAVGQLSDSSAQINEIIEVISSIAGQTNLLALNAAIEAARAGEQGRGFAVVAEEVRKLAEESETAAVKIKALLQVNQSNINLAVQAMQSNADNVKEGIEVVDAAGKSFNDITSSIVQVTERIGDIVKAVESLNKQAREVNTLSGNINDVSRQTAGEAENILAVIEEQTATNSELMTASSALAQLAEKLSEQVDSFKI